jgi:hypothetical protein
VASNKELIERVRLMLDDRDECIDKDEDWEYLNSIALLVPQLCTALEQAEASDAESIAMYRRARDRADQAESERYKLRAKLEQAEAERDRLRTRLGLPVADPIRHGSDDLVAAVLSLAAQRTIR